MRPDTLHTTLVFLGEIAESRLEALSLAAQEVHGEAFALRLDAPHYWGHNHIVHAAPRQTPPALVALVGDLERHLNRHRFDFERREYKPHVTLLRHAQWTDASLPEMPPVIWWLREFVLLESLSNEAGARYEVRARFPLA